jgi:uncharacterized membrane-anchored protein YhcB (DUF1043 family)
MEHIRKELRDLAKTIEKKEKELSSIHGSNKELLKRLTKELGFKTFEEAEKWLASTSMSLEKEEEKLKKEFNELKEEYEF